MCPECAAEVDAQRQARSALRDSRPIAIPSSLLGLLSQIPQDTAQVQPPEDNQTNFADGAIRGRRKRR
jgi:hypothetical protein